MSNRMKIKPVRVKMTRAQAERYYDRLCCCVAFVNTAAIGRMDTHAQNIHQAVQDEELLWKVKLVEYTDDLRHVLRKMVEFLSQRVTKCTVSTAPLLMYGQEGYMDDSRLVHNMQALVHKKLSFRIADLETKARTIALNQNVASKRIVGECLTLVSWVRILELYTKRCIQDWRNVMGKGAQINIATLFLNQSRGAGNLATKIVEELGDTAYNGEAPMWKQYHKAEDDLGIELGKLLDDDRFNDVVMEYNTTDWVEYYIGNALMLSKRNDGKVPEQIASELKELGKRTDRELLLPFSKMASHVSKKIESSDDPYDYLDYLDTHQWKARESIRQSALEFVNNRHKPLNTQPA